MQVIFNGIPKVYELNPKGTLCGILKAFEIVYWCIKGILKSITWHFNGEFNVY